MGEELPHDPNTEQATVEQPPDQQNDLHLGGVALNNDTEIPDSYIRDEEKAEVMAHAENDSFDSGERYPQNASLSAGIEYDIAIAKANTKGYEPNEAEKKRSKKELSRYNIHKRNQVLRYSDAITKHNEQTGDKSSPNLLALTAVHDLVQSTVRTEFSTDTEHDYWGDENVVTVTFDEHENVVVRSGAIHSDTGKEEKFTLSMFHGARYEVTELSSDTEDFDLTTVTRERTLRPEDIDRLKEILAPAITRRDEERRQDEEYQRAIDEAEHEEQHQPEPTDTSAYQAGWSETYNR